MVNVARVGAHPVVLRGASLAGVAARPVILARRDQDFIPAVLEELRSESGRAAAAATIASAAPGGTLRLFQAVHRTFNIAVLEVACDTFGGPRLDPAKVESAGLVVRRVPTSNAAGGELEGWMQAGAKFRGWVRFGSAADMDEDPEPARRRKQLRSGNPEIDRLLRAQSPNGNGGPPLAESTTPLFAAPPDVCKAAGKTYLYGLVPTSSSDVSEAPTAPLTYTSAQAAALVPSFLQAGGPRTPTRAGQLLSPAHASEASMREFVDTLGFLASSLALFDADKPTALRTVLQGVMVETQTAVFEDAYDMLRRASLVLLERRGDVGVRMPLRWPSISSSTANAVRDALKGNAESRLAGLTPRQGRFASPSRQYRLRAFVRVRRDDGCPPDLWWSEPSEPFTIVPWYETGDAPPVQVTLPNPTIANLKKLKPTVAFVSEESLFRKMKTASLNDLLDGKEPGGGPSLGLRWICAFNIPIITLCALIVLGIFLSLMNFIFFWLPFVFICLPFPRLAEED
jgi:hypothetical protein